jgi:hypothetical protein
MTGDRGGSGLTASRSGSSAAAQPASRYSVAAVYQRVEPGRVQNFLRHVTVSARSQDEALGGAIALIEKKDCPAGAIPDGAGLAMHSVMLVDRNDSEDRTEAEGEATQTDPA